MCEKLLAKRWYKMIKITNCKRLFHNNWKTAKTNGFERKGKGVQMFSFDFYKILDRQISQYESIRIFFSMYKILFDLYKIMSKKLAILN